jgi:cell wall-associated NlpC family hydrolase
VTPIVASHKRACRRTGLLRGTGVVVTSLAVAGFTVGVVHAEPVGGSRDHDAGKGNNAASEMPESADSAAGDSPEAVERQVAGLYQQVDADTQAYDAAQERIAQLQALVAGDGLRAAQLRDRLAMASAGLGRLAAQQYRDEGMSPEMTLVFASHPDVYLERAGMNDRLADIARRRVLAALTDRQDLAALEREASVDLSALKAAQTQLAAQRADIETRLADARGRLDALGAVQRQEVTAALARGGTGAGAADGLGTTVSVAAPTLSSLIAAIAVSSATGPVPGTPQPVLPLLGANPGSAAALGAAASSAGSAGAAPSATNPNAPASPGAAAATAGGTSSQQAANQPMSSGDEARTVRAISAAYSELGKPYVWGATGPNQFDCSGLTQHVWAAAGVMLPRTSQEQANAGQSVALSDIRPGDLVVYYSGQTHVGIYVGQGLVIHAPRPGAVVQFAPVGSMPIDKIIRPV